MIVTCAELGVWIRDTYDMLSKVLIIQRYVQLSHLVIFWKGGVSFPG